MVMKQQQQQNKGHSIALKITKICVPAITRVCVDFIAPVTIKGNVTAHSLRSHLSSVESGDFAINGPMLI